MATQSHSPYAASPHSGFRMYAGIYGVSAVITIAIWMWVGIVDGWIGLLSVITLTALEVTFSFDNAVINAKVLVRMSAFWQRLFMTVGIFIAVFVVRFALPIVIVQITAGLGFLEVLDLALNKPEAYATELRAAGPMIEAFGGTFLMMIGVSYFLDHKKDVHWLAPIERRLAPLGRFDNIAVFVMLGVAAVIYFTIGGEAKDAVLIAAVLGVLLHVGLGLFAALFEKDEDEAEDQLVQPDQVKGQVGMAAFATFMYLEVLDASFSFDGVIGAFAITTSVLLIVAGLGAGAIWVRSMTVHMVRASTLSKYRFLEHGAHWAILALGTVMLVKLYHIEPPEWVTGSIGLFFIGFAIFSSVVHRKRDEQLEAVEKGLVSTR